VSFIFKLDQLEPAVRAFAEAGGDIRLIQPDVREVDRLIRKQDYDAAARVIDRILERIRTWRKDEVA
jgi:hypothetical protein